jgi:Rrf2 family iron-sulfur cluster assembly transcriptional regulator
MKLTTKGRYGVRAVVNLAATAGNEPVSIGEIARKERLSPEFLEQIFFRLKKAGLVRSLRGPRGGFLLNRKASEISLKLIMDAVGESLFPAPCANHDPSVKTCPRAEGCLTAPIWHGFYDLINKYLSEITLKDILESGKTPAR